MNANSENDNPGANTPASRKRSQDALELGPRKKPCSTDPLVHHGRHFGRTVHALCNIPALISNGIIRMAGPDAPDESLTEQERRERKVFHSLLLMVPNLEERIMNTVTEKPEEVHMMATLLQKGVSSARSDDTKSIKSAIIDWLAPPGEPLIPPIPRNGKIQRGFHHERTGALLCPAGVDWSNPEIKQKLRSGEFSVAGDQWPMFLYYNHQYDEEDPWKGLFRGEILVKAFKHIFTSPSSVDREAKATRSGNARIHGMTSVTCASIAYAAMQARFALSSQSTFCRSDVTDSERFYNSILELLEHSDEKKEVGALLVWWNRRVFPNYVANSKPVSVNSVLAKIKAKRAAAKSAALTDASNT